MKRILILGLPGSGKTALAKKLSDKYGLRHIELDSFYWDGDWGKIDYKIFEKNIKNHLKNSEDRWVVDNYSSKLQKMGLIDRLDTVILLDIPLWLCLLRVSKRSFVRIVSRKKLWDGPIETPRSAIGLLLLMPKWGKGFVATFSEMEREKQPEARYVRYKNNKKALKELLK